jgi:LuxR family maltose regulon positive regulatory protein
MSRWVGRRHAAGHLHRSVVADQFGSQLRLRASPPAIPPELVRRRRLEERLNGGSPRPVTLVSAGPGSGKTLAVASWVDAVPVASAWLSVDESDNDLRTLWSDVLGALALGAVLPADSALLQMVPAATFGPPEVLRVRAGLAELPGPVVLILDDVHHLRNGAVLDSISELIEHQPPGLRLVLVTRTDPAVRLHLLRVSGRLTEIRSQDLAFTADEAAELFALDGVDLTGDQLRVLLDRTQGWPAGLRLAALSLADADVTEGITRFTGIERSVSEYLIGEVLNRRPAPDRDFLLKTSITERINASLATALTGRTDSQLILENLVAANAFVVSLGGTESWFRYHPLLRELMEHLVDLEQPGTTVELHATAAEWFAAHGDPIQAIRHATAAGEWDEVGRLLASFALPLILTPDATALASALQPAMRRSIQQPTLSTLLAGAIWHYHRRDFDAMNRDTREATEFLPAAPDDLRIPAEILIAITTLTYDRGTASAGLVRSSAHLLSLLDQAPRRLVPAARHYRAIGLNNVGVGQLWAGDLADAETNLTAAAAQAEEFGVDLALAAAHAHLAVRDVMQGRLRSAHHRATTARRVVDRRGWASEPQALGLYVALSMTELAWNRTADAAAAVDAGLVASSHGGSDNGCRLALGIAAVGVAGARGDTDAARSAAERLAAELARVSDPPDLLGRWCRVALAQAELISGDPEAVIRRIQRPAGGRGFAAALERVMLAKAHLALGDLEALPVLLDSLTQPDSPHLGPAVDARILLSIAADRQHRDTAALAGITEVIDLAEPEGLIRPFFDAGPAVAGLLTRHRHVIGRHLDFTQQLFTDTRPLPAAPEAMIGEHLTERELIVLRYLPTMLKAAEIAKDLFVSVNTVKSHQRAIYRKLDVTTRRAAVERARDLNLV